MASSDLIVVITALFILSACEEDKCQQHPNSSANYQSAFDHCMDKASNVSKNGTHDNSYNTIEECESYAIRMDRAMCQEKKP